MANAKKIKSIIKGCAEPSKFGSDPSDPWSAKSNVNEAGSLHDYLNSRGINPKFLSRDAKISHAKSSQYMKWKKDHQFEEVEQIDEDAMLDTYLKARGMNPLTITKEKKISIAKSSAFLTWKMHHMRESISEGAFKRIATDREEDARLKKMSALDKFRADAAAREKKHAEIQKKSGGMTAAIDRLQKHLNKEETEQIDELKKSTVKSWLGKQEVVPPKKPGMDKKAHNQRIKTRSKSWDSAIDRLTGRKPTSEDVFADSQAATQSNFDGANAPDNTEPQTPSRKQQMSKSARIIKSIYKRKQMKEELYDHEKEDKSVATYGKKPKMQKGDDSPNQQSYGDTAPQAAAVLKGGKTLTGQTRDTLEIDPMMRRPLRPDQKQADQKEINKK